MFVEVRKPNELKFWGRGKFGGPIYEQQKYKNVNFYLRNTFDTITLRILVVPTRSVW